MDQHVGSELPPIPETEQRQTNTPSNHETEGPANATEKTANQAIETNTAQSQAALAPPPANPLIPQPTGQPQAANPAPNNPGRLPGMPAIADDTDLIEKEWVIKAKEIVARTRHDPYQQNKEVESFKADYMKKRYNKDIKLTED